MLADPAHRLAVRETLTVSRDEVDDRLRRIDVPSLTVFGAADDHFPDPTAEARATSRALNGEHLIVEGAGHYPHVERPHIVAAAGHSFHTGVA